MIILYKENINQRIGNQCIRDLRFGPRSGQFRTSEEFPINGFTRFEKFIIWPALLSWRHGSSALSLTWLVCQDLHLIFFIQGCGNGSIFHYQSQSNTKTTAFCRIQKVFFTCRIALELQFIQPPIFLILNVFGCF